MNKIRFKEMIAQEDWNSIIKNFSYHELCSLLNFNEAMHLVKHLAYDDFGNSDHQQFALNFILEVTNHFKLEWEKDWKHEVFLGDLYSFMCLYDEQYLCYKKAYDQLEDPPATLLFFLSTCNSAPGTPPITDEEAESYLRRALSKKLTYEIALSMRSLCKDKGDTIQADNWDQQYNKLKKEKIKLDYIIPDALVD